MEEEILRILHSWPTYPPSNKPYDKIIVEWWLFESHSPKEARKGFKYLKLWKENALNKEKEFFDFQEDQMIYRPVWHDTNNLWIQPATLSLKIALKPKASTYREG